MFGYTSRERTIETKRMNPVRSPQKNRSIFVGRDRGKVRRIGRSTLLPPLPPFSGRTGRSVLRVCHSAAYGLEFRTSCPRTRITVSAVMQKDSCVRKTGRPYHILRNIKRFAQSRFSLYIQITPLLRDTFFNTLKIIRDVLPIDLRYRKN